MFQMALILLRSRISRKSRWFSVELVANKEYDIDFKRIHVNFSESEKEFIKSCKGRAKK